MSVQHSQESEYALEMVKWEAFPTMLGKGLRPYVKREYPWMIYRAGRLDDGAIGIQETLVVASDVEAANAFSRGFHPGPQEALDGCKAQELEIAKAAANRNFHDLRMTAKAQAEVAQAEDEYSGHMPEKPHTPIVKRQLKGQPWSAARRAASRPKTGDQPDE